MTKTLFFWVLLTTAALAQEVRYTIRFPNVVHNEAEIEARFEKAPPTLELRMARSSPGRYAAMEFAINVYNLRAVDGAGKPLSVSRPNPHQWNVSGHDGTVVIRYTLYAARGNGTWSALDESRALLNAPSTWIWARGFDNRPAVVTLEPPTGSGWEVATQLEPVSEYVFKAPHLDYLLDSPILAGKLQIREWNAAGQTIRLALQHTGTEDQASAFARMTEAAVIELEGLFGELPRFDFGVYTFLVDLMPQTGGDGMEHRNSTVVSGSRSIQQTQTGPIGTVIHEFLHAWNVERIRPKSLEPFNYEDANVSEELWFAEGFTSYYSPLVMRRAGMITLAEFGRSLAGSVNAVLFSPGREVFSAVEMSQWAPFGDGGNSVAQSNAQNIFVSYYPYGAALGLGIDLAIRSEFPGKSLDDWMRAMWQRHGRYQKDYKPERPYTMADLEQALASVTSAEFASRIFRKHVRGKEPMDYAALLEKAGFLLRNAPGDPWLGSTALRFAEDGATLTGGTVRGSPLYEAGIDRGHRITELDGKPIRKNEDLTAWLKSREPGDTVKAKVVTHLGPRDLTFTLAAKPAVEVLPFEAAGRTLSPQQNALRQSWLSSKAKRPLPELRRYCSHGVTVPFEFNFCPNDGKPSQITPAADSSK